MTTDQEKELKDLVRRLDAYQAALKLSDGAWCARYGRYIGTAKTWRERMHGGKMAELSTTAPKWIGQLRTLITIFEGGSVLEEFYETPFYKRVKRGVETLEGQTNDRRCYVVLAETGTGKTVAARKLASEHITTRTCTSALTHWRENKVAILQGLCEALGCKPLIGGAGPAMDALKLTLRATPRTLFIDEAHQGGVMLMRLIKDLINETPSRFVYLALATEFVRVQGATSGSIVEARQFLGRCIKPICDDWRGGCTQRDVAEYLKAALNGESWATVAHEIAAAVRRNYNLRLLADAVDAARNQADDDDSAVTAELVIEHVRELTKDPAPASA
jgi:DNA transposition AAA+ family ATPase